MKKIDRAVERAFGHFIEKLFAQNKAAHINEQRERLRRFDKDLITYTAEYPDFLKYLFGFFVLMFMCFPAQELHEMKELYVALFLFGCFPVMYGLKADMVVRDDKLKPAVPVYGKIRYLPIDKKVWKCVKMEYALSFCLKMVTIALIVQNVVAYIAYRELSWGNFAYPIAMTLVLPICVRFLDVSTHCR